MNQLKRFLGSAMMVPGMRTVLTPWRRGIGSIFMLHRFTDPATGVVGHDPENLRRTLRQLRRRGYELVTLSELFRRLQEDASPGDLGVAFTLDDGYADQVRIAGPVFAEFECPATIFVTTGFLDGRLWFWWDRIEFIFQQSKRPEVVVELAGQTLTYQLNGSGDRSPAIRDFTNRCKVVWDGEKHAGIQNLARAAEVELPAQPPARYAPMSWSELREWEQRGINFGPHTVTHPILSRTDDSQSRHELIEGWTRLQSESRRPTPVFCYPNGQREDFSERETAVLRGIGHQGAVVGTSGYADVMTMRSGPEGPFQVRRFSYPDDPQTAFRCVSGFERLRGTLGGSE